MSTFRRRVPSPALVVSVVALIVALGGTSYAAFTLPKNSVGTKQLKNGAVTNGKLAANAVGTAKIKNGAVTNGKLAANAVGTAKIKNGAVTGAKMNFAGVTVPNATRANSLPALTWTSLTLQNGWANYSSNLFGPPGLQYTKDAEGFVHLRGTVSGTGATNGSVIATLPTGFIPPSGAWVSIAETNNASDPHAEAAWIDSSGNIRVYEGTGGNNAFVSFEGAEFYTG
jgi:hypothetical protein